MVFVIHHIAFKISIFINQNKQKMEENDISHLLNEHDKRQLARPRLQKVLDELMKIVSQGQHNLYGWSELKKLFKEENGMMCLADMFFVNIGILSINQTILECSKLLEDDTESINVWLLFNVSESGVKEFFDSRMHDTIKAEIVKDRGVYGNAYKEHQNIKHKRDKEIAHTDKKVMTRSMNDPQVTAEIEQLEGLLGMVEDTLRKYYKFAGYKAASNFEEHRTWARENWNSNFDLTELRYVLAVGLEHLPEDAPKHIKFHQTMRETKNWYRKNTKNKDNNTR